MKCFKHLCAGLFLCFLSGLFTLEVKAADVVEPATETAESVVATDALNAVIAVAPTNSATALMAAANARAQDVDRLSRVIQTEGGTFDDKVCVGLTALHRVDSPQFPNTVEENINAPSQYAKPAKGTVLPENLLAAEYAMKLWESGLSYSVLPEGYLYFAGNGKRNRFRNAGGDHYDAPDITQFIPYIIAQGPDGALICVRNLHSPSLTAYGFRAKMDVGGNHLGSCLWVTLPLVFYDDGNFFVLRLAHESKVKLYFHNVISFHFLFSQIATGKREPEYLPRTHPETQIPVESLKLCA